MRQTANDGVDAGQQSLLERLLWGRGSRRRTLAGVYTAYFAADRVNIIGALEFRPVPGNARRWTVIIDIDEGTDATAAAGAAGSDGNRRAAAAERRVTKTG